MGLAPLLSRLPPVTADERASFMLAKPPDVVFARGDSPYFWVRFSVPGQGQRRIRLKTMDEAEAYKRAELEYLRAVWSAG